MWVLRCVFDMYAFVNTGELCLEPIYYSQLFRFTLNRGDHGRLSDTEAVLIAASIYSNSVGDDAGNLNGYLLWHIERMRMAGKGIEAWMPDHEHLMQCDRVARGLDRMFRDKRGVDDDADGADGSWITSWVVGMLDQYNSDGDGKEMLY